MSGSGHRDVQRRVRPVWPPGPPAAAPTSAPGSASADGTSFSPTTVVPPAAGAQVVWAGSGFAPAHHDTVAGPLDWFDAASSAAATTAPASSAAAGAAVEVDHALVRQLQATVSERLHRRMHGREVSPDEQRQITAEITGTLVREHTDNLVAAGEPVAAGYEHALVTAITANLLGLGRLQPLLDDPLVENIMVNGHDRVRVEYADGRVDTNHRAAASDADLVELLQRAAARYGLTERTLSTAKPVLHLRLPDGSRLVAAYLVTQRPVVVIRRHRVRQVTLDDLVRFGSITPLLAAFLTAAVRGYLNIMIAGLPNAGKTTLLRAVAAVIDPDEWFATMETERELGLDETGGHPWAVAFEERQGHGERGPDGRPEGEINLSDLFPHMLRMSTTRVIVGEVRSAEIVSMFDAGDTTHGTLSTIHARHPHAVFDRLAGLLMRYGASRSRDGAYLQVANALDLVVFCGLQRLPGRPPRRYVSHVVEVNGVGEHGGIARSDLFAPHLPGGLGEPTGVQPCGRIADALRYGGFDLRHLTTPTGWEPQR